MANSFESREFFKIGTDSNIELRRKSMEAYKTILTKLDVRQFDSKKVPAEVKLRVLEAARATGTGLNKQEWRFILIQEKEMVKKLAEDSTSGGWVVSANFAVIVLKPVVVVAFGYPVKKIIGKKNRMPLTELAFIDKYGSKLDPKKLM